MSVRRFFPSWLASRLSRRRATLLAGLLALSIGIGVVALLLLSPRGDLDALVIAAGSISLLVIAGLYFAARTLSFAHRISAEVLALRASLRDATEKLARLEGEARTARLEATETHASDIGAVRSSIAALQGTTASLGSSMSEAQAEIRRAAAVRAEINAQMQYISRDLAGHLARYAADSAEIQQGLKHSATVLAELEGLRRQQANASSLLESLDQRLGGVHTAQLEAWGRLEDIDGAVGKLEKDTTEHLAATAEDRSSLARLQRQIVTLVGVNDSKHERIEILAGQAIEAASSIGALDKKHTELTSAVQALRGALADVMSDEAARHERLSSRLELIEELGNETTRLASGVQREQSALGAALADVERRLAQSSERIAASAARLEDVHGWAADAIAASQEGLERTLASIEIIDERQAALDARSEEDTTRFRQEIAELRQRLESASAVAASREDLEKVSAAIEAFAERQAASDDRHEQTTSAVAALANKITAEAARTGQEIDRSRLEITDLRERLDAQVADLLKQQTEGMLALEGIGDRQAEANGKLIATSNALTVAAGRLDEMEAAITALGDQAARLNVELSGKQSALEGKLDAVTSDLQGHHDSQLREISAKVEEQAATLERQLASMAARLDALDELARDASTAEQTRLMAQELSDVIQLVNEAELALVSDIAQLAGEAADHTNLLAAVRDKIRDLEARAKDGGAVSTELTAIVARVDSKAISLSQSQAEMTGRIAAIEASLRAIENEAGSLPMEPGAEDRQSAPRRSMSAQGTHKETSRKKSRPAPKASTKRSNANGNSSRKKSRSARNRR